MNNFKNYVKQLNLEQLFRRLKSPKPELLAKEVTYFTIKEARNRDKILVNYFGKNGINSLTDVICNFLLATPSIPADADVLDVGAGTGFFTVKVYRKLRERLPKVRFYALDATPAMLTALEKRGVGIVPFVGIAESIKGSINEARKFFEIPHEFDAVFSTLMLHHSPEPENVFRSIKEVLKRDGKAAIVDLCSHKFEEFKAEMGDIHMGFKSEDVYRMSQKYFSKVIIEVMEGIHCECSGRSAQLFVAFLHNGK
ncbi:MAG: class I SAM-dependent methyltransferase [Candidatus Bathyarchaeia archaeon]